MIQKTGVFNKECHQWRKKEVANKTWDNFKRFFKEEYDDNKEENTLTVVGLGLNATKENTIAANDATAQDRLKHLAAATAADCTVVVNLTSANAKLSSKLQDKNTAYASLQKSLEKVQNQLVQLERSKQTLATPRL